MLHINCFSKTIHNYNNFMLICSIGKIIVSIDSYPSGKRFCSIFYMSCRFKYSVCSLSKIEKKKNQYLSGFILRMWWPASWKKKGLPRSGYTSRNTASVNPESLSQTKYSISPIFPFSNRATDEFRLTILVYSFEK